MIKKYLQKSLKNDIYLHKEDKKLLDNTPNQPTKFRTKNSVEINDDARGTYNFNGQIKFETLVLSSSLYDYRDGYRYILVSETITVAVLAAGRKKNTI